MTINNDFASHVKRCGTYHKANSGGTWITDELVDLLVAIDKDIESGVKMYCFELWDGDVLCAVSCGMAIGTFFHDFTMATFVADPRGCGGVLSRAVGELLTLCGIEMWYWGIKAPYMGEYDSYGGHEGTRVEYWRAVTRGTSGEGQVTSPAATLLANRSPIPPHPVKKGGSAS